MNTSPLTRQFILIRGAGDVASGVIVRLAKAGFRLLVTELAQPLSVRRLACYSEAVYLGNVAVDNVTCQRCDSFQQITDCQNKGIVPLIIDPDAFVSLRQKPLVVIDARMAKRMPETGMHTAEMVIGLGPGFIAGINCHAVIETNRGPNMGRVYWSGSAEADTGVPETVAEYQMERVLRSPGSGILNNYGDIGMKVKKDQKIGDVAGVPIVAQFDGILRGLLKNGSQVTAGMKIGDVDPRNDPRLCLMISDKALAVGGGVLEAVLSRVDIRKRLYL